MPRGFGYYLAELLIGLHTTFAMQPTPHDEVNQLLDYLRHHMRRILDQRLLGLYLYGSLVSGDFDPVRSDVDLLAVTATEIDDDAFARLDAMHQEWVTSHPAWADRIEVAYLSHAALQTFRTRASTIGIISPGEPFHRKAAGKEWLVNWWLVREQGITLFGPPPTALIDPITRAEFLQTVRDHARFWREWIHDAKGWHDQAYAILTLCRALYTSHHGEQVSKREAARWAQARCPQWARLIRQAWAWRSGQIEAEIEPDFTFAEIEHFIRFAIAQIEADEFGASDA